jgi:two-component system, cell cycle sensor histidine kinase and response regulator CckA
LGYFLSLRRKTLLIVAMTLTGLCAALYVIARTTVLERFVQLENNEIRQDLDRVSNTLTNEYDLLTTTTRDDSQWDEAHQFVNQPTPTWGETNFPNSTLLALRLNLIAYMNHADQPVHAREFDVDSGEQEQAAREVIQQLVPLSRMARQRQNQGVGGIVLLPDGPMLVSAWPVLQSTGKGPVAGALLMGRRLDSAELRRLAWASSLQFDIFPLRGHLPRDVAQAHAGLAKTEVVVAPLGRSAIAGYTVLKDYRGEPALILRVQTRRQIYEQGRLTLMYLMAFTLFVGVVFAILTLLLLESQVLSRLISLTRSVGAIGVRSGLSERVKVQGTDEISYLAGSINQMLASLERAEREREVPEAYLEGLFETAPEAVVIVDSHHRVVRVNQEFSRMFGYSLDDARGRDLDRLIVPASLTEEAVALNAQVEQGKTVALETMRRTSSGSTVDVSILGTPVNIGGGRVAFYAIYRDITERKRSELLHSVLYRIADKATSAQNLEDLFAEIHKMLGELMFAKNCYIALYDASAQMVSFPYFVDEKDLAAPPPHKFRKGLTEYVLRTGKPLLATPEILDSLVRQGEVESRVGARSRDWMGVPLKQGESTFGVLTVQTYEENIRYGEAEKGILTFVSQQIASAIIHRRNQDAIRESESRFRSLAENAAPALYIYSNRFYYVNPSTARLFGYSRAELMAMEDPWKVLVHPDFVDMARERSQARLRGEAVASHYEFKIITKSGEERWVDFSASTAPIQFAGKPANIAIVVDVTERKWAEQLQTALYRIASTSNSAEDLQELFAAIHGIVGELMDARNFYVALYDAAKNLVSFPYFVDEEDATDEPRPPKKGLTEYLLRTGRPLLANPEVFERLVANGEVETVGAPSLDWLGVPLKTGDTTFGVLVVQSYSEKVRFGEREKEILTFVSQQVASAIQHKRNQQALQDSEVRYRTLVQSAVYGIFGWNLEDQFTDVNPALVSILGYDSAEEVLALGLTSDVYADQTQHKEIVNTLLTVGQLRGMEVQWRRKDGKGITVRISGRALLDGEKTTGFEVIAEDITERRFLEEQLRQSQKMEAVGQLAGGIAHDFNNLLTIIKGNSQLLLERLHEADSRRAGVEQIQKASDKAASLTSQLLAFSRKQVVAFRVLDLNAVLSNMVQLLPRLLGERIELSIVQGKDLGRVKADPGQIEQIIMNLALNARDAMPNGGRLTVETKNIDIEQSYGEAQVQIEPGRYVQLAVSDTGIGIEPEALPHIFEPFFTTKPVGKGTGLGLSTVYGIVQQSNGHIWASSQRGMGTTFRLYLPRVDQPAESLDVERGSPEFYAGFETVLLVEDEDGVRSLIQLLLQRNGYKVLEAHNAEEALQIVDSNKGRIHLLLTDLILPRLSGRELAERISLQRPEIKCLFMSGYTDDSVVKSGVLDQQTAFLQKPFSMETLLQKIREVLGQAAAAH